MKIENLKDLQKLIQLCRKLGVDAMEVDSIKFNLGPAPKGPKSRNTDTIANDFPEASIKIPQYSGIAPSASDIIKTNELTKEQLLMWSAQDNEQQG